MNIVMHWPQWVFVAWVGLMLLNAVLPPVDWEELALKLIIWGGLSVVLAAGGFFTQACMRLPVSVAVAATD